MATPEIPLVKPRNAEQQMMHPCEFIQRSAFQQEEALRMNRIRSTHGIGSAVEVGLTEVTLLGSRRLGAMPTSHALYHAYRGDYTDLKPTDLYGLPENDPNVQPSARALAERDVYGYELTMKKLGM